MTDPKPILQKEPAHHASIVVREYKTADRKWVTDANVSHYRRVEGFDYSFESVVLNALDMLEERLTDSSSRYLVVEATDTHLPVGCIFFSAEEEKVGRLRLFYLDQMYRGQGIGRDLVGDVFKHALKESIECVRVSTFDQHEAACRLYYALGFKVKTSNSVRAFGKRLRQMDFEKVLRDHSC